MFLRTASILQMKLLCSTGLLRYYITPICTNISDNYAAEVSIKVYYGFQQGFMHKSIHFLSLVSDRYAHKDSSPIPRYFLCHASLLFLVNPSWNSFRLPASFLNKFFFRCSMGISGRCSIRNLIRHCCRRLEGISPKIIKRLREI